MRFPVAAARVRWLVLWVVVLALSVAAVGAYTVLVRAPHEHRAARGETERELGRVCETRAALLDHWVRDAIADALTVADFPSPRMLLLRASGRPAGSPDESLTDILTRFGHQQRYSQVVLAGPDSRPLLQSGGAVLTEGCGLAARRAFERRAPAVALHDHESGPAIALAAPVLDDTGEPIGAAVVESSLSTFAPLLEPRPTGDGLAAVVLFARDAPEGPARAVTPSTRTEARDQIALTSLTDPDFGAGEPVIAATRALRSVPWTLVIGVPGTAVELGVDARLWRTAVLSGGLLASALTMVLLLLWGRELTLEAGLTRERARLLQLLDAASDAVLFIDAEGRIRHCNARAERLYERPASDLVGQHVRTLRPPGEQTLSMQQHETIIREGKLVFEAVHLAADGRPIPVEVSADLVTVGGDSWCVSVVRDVTDRKASEARIIRLNRLLRTMSSVRQAIATVTDRQVLLTTVCEMAVEAGFPLAWIGRAEADRTVYLAAVAGPASAYTKAIDVRWDDSALGRGPAGTAIRERRTVVVRDAEADPCMDPWRSQLLAQSLLSVASSPIVSGAEVFGAVTLYAAERDAFDLEAIGLLEELATDIGLALERMAQRDLLAEQAEELAEQRSRAADTLRQSEAQFRAVFDYAGLGIELLDLSGRPIRVNSAFARMLGRSEAELQPLRFDQLTHPDDRAAEEPLFAALVRGEREHYETDKRYVHRNGDTVWASVTVSLVRDREGHPVFTVVLADDITDRRRLQEQFLQAQKMEGIGRLAGGVAHDFNNLLTAIMGYTELLRDDLPSDHASQPFVDEVAKAAARAATLTTQLLAFARRQMIEPRPLDLNAIVCDAERMLRRLVGEDVEIVVETDEHLGVVEADPGQIDQILVNLAVNARDAMPGGGRLIIETHNVVLDRAYGRLHVDLEPGPYVMLVVSDTGHGMTADVQAKLFEPFFTTKERGKGTGLGLATCHGIVNQAGGGIHVYSEPGLGTTFRIYLPRVQRDVYQEPDRPAPPPLAGGHETVLLAEDEPSVRGLASLSLRAHGYRVLEATNGTHALAVAAAHRDAIDLLVTDVVMPGVNGRELARRFQEIRPAAEVLFISGHAESAIVHHGVLEPGVAFLPKPFTPERLVRRVRELLDTGSRRQQRAS